jgi:glycerol-3-phosphate acyltransferase PlsY
MPWMGHFHAENWSQGVCIALGAYLLGCFATGYYLVHHRTGQDIREVGSGSVGARNVGRLLGWQSFVAVLLGDLAKGILAVWVTGHFIKDDRQVGLAMLGVVAGHLWPAQLHFRGGKGVATSLGALLIFDPHLLGAFAVFFAAAFVLLRKTVLPGLFAFACLPIASFFMDHTPGKVVEISILAVMVFVAHRRNLVEEISHLIDRRHIEPKTHHREL